MVMLQSIGSYFVTACLLVGGLSSPATLQVSSSDDALRTLALAMIQRQSDIVLSYPGCQADFGEGGAYEDVLACVAGTYIDGIHDQTYLVCQVESIVCWPEVLPSGEEAIHLSVTYATTYEQEQELDAVLSSIASSLGRASRYETVQAVYEYVASHVSYGAGSFYDTVMHGQGMCYGYAFFVQRLLTLLGVPCSYVGSTDHAWNLVWMEDGLSYHVDATNGYVLVGNATYPLGACASADADYHPLPAVPAEPAPEPAPEPAVMESTTEQATEQVVCGDVPTGTPEAPLETSTLAERIFARLRFAVRYQTRHLLQFV